MKEPRLISLNCPKLLIGEGTDEERVFTALVKHAGLDRQIQVLRYDGKTNLGKFLHALPKLPGINQVDSLGITRDADVNAANTRTSVDAAIQNASFPPALKVSVFILPGENRPGTLEDLLCPALESHAAWSCVEQMVACRTEKSGAWPNHVANLGKAKVEAWLSLQDRPTIRLGEAADAALLPFDHPAFAPLLAFIRTL